jgi:uncharacterized protein YdaU (DUF1376 family)
MEAGRVNFIRLYIGDYLRDTGTLTVTEHGAYFLMLLHHYATETPLPRGRDLARLLRAETKCEREAIETVAGKFWAETAGGLSNGRAGKEMQRAEHQRDVNRTVGKLGGRPKRTQTESVIPQETESLTESEPNANPNQTPDTRHHISTPSGVERARKRAPARPDGVDAQVWDDWRELRKAKKAPVTQTAVNRATAEAAKAGMSLNAFLSEWCGRGSQGLKAAWLESDKRNGSQSFAERASAAKSERLAEMTGGLLGAPQRPSNVIDMEEGNAPLRIA